MKNEKSIILLSLVAVVLFSVSCNKTPVNAPGADYRDQWMGEYAYITDRDGGMEGTIYADKTGDRYVNVYIGGIGDLKKMEIGEDGSLSLVENDYQGNYYWYNSFTGRFTEDSLYFEYYIQSEPRTKVSYHGCKINGNTSPNREYPVDYRDKWIGKYQDISVGTDSTQVRIYKVSYTKVGITSIGYPWEIVFNVGEDGNLTVVKSSSEWGNYRDFEGMFTEDRLSYHFQMLGHAGVINRSFVYRKL